MSPPRAPDGRLSKRIFGWRGALLGTLIVPTGSGVAVGALAAHVLEPHWTAGGWAYATGYPKNVEIAATLIGVAAGGFSAALARWPLAWAAALVVAIGGFGYVARVCSGLPGVTVLTVLMGALPFVCGLECLRVPARRPPVGDRRLWIASVVLLGTMLFLLAAHPRKIDTFHDGELLASALDLLAGGRPFLTYPWPHGLHDTGLAALWIAATGKVGTSPVALALASCSALAAPAFYLLIRPAPLRTALGRSDVSHFYWFYPVLLCTAALCMAPLLAWAADRARYAVGAVVAVAAVTTGARVPQLASGWRGLAEHLRPNAPVGVCADTTFTAAEAAIRSNARFIDATCRLEQLLRARGVHRLLLDHSAPWYHSRFGMPPPSRYYSLNKAFTPEAQQQFIADVRAADVQALLAVRGYGALAQYDVPNAYRVPIIEAYLRARRRGAPAIDTPLGRLYLWNEPDAANPPASPPVTADERLALQGTGVTAVPSTGFVEVRGWTRDLGGAAPRIGLVRTRAGDAEITFAAPQRTDATGAAPMVSTWSLVARATPVELAGLAVELQGADGRLLVSPELPPARELPPLAGPEWRDLHAAVDAAAALGAADRAAARQRESAH